MRISDVSEKRIWSHETAIYYPAGLQNYHLGSVLKLDLFYLSFLILHWENADYDVSKTLAFLHSG
jgi:hypothetical protein